jgi:2-polyprenyl-3-methyl-5-hydroxy-6-metoxy-1,4-benzoquinol methylase
MSDRASFANADVLEFYKTLPFNIRESVEGSVDAVRRTDHAAAYPVLAPLLHPGIRVIDVGCGTGWMSNSLAYHHQAVVTGLDFNPVAIARAREVASAMQLSSEFIVGDLFKFSPDTPFDLAISLGVLHHTDNCAAAVRHVCEDFVKPGGHVLIGLYHLDGRRPFLEHFAEMRARGATDEQMFARYRELHSQITDDTLLMSWFRDQVLHPHETQHTLQEMMPILDETGFDLVSTSINRFEPIQSREELFAAERGYAEIGAERLRANQYFTGFFVFLARKRAAVTSLDTKPYVQHHPTFGHQYVPGVAMSLPRPGGGRYRINVNSQGIRADREYARAKPIGVQRIVVCGDSMPAGQFVTNADRFGELLERRVPNLEVINLSLEGSGTDQQVLLYEHVGLQYEHDLVVLLPFLQNVRRNMVDAREAIDAKTGRPTLRPKPRFELIDGELALRNVPVPKEMSASELSTGGRNEVGNARVHRIKTRIASLPGAAVWRRAVQTFVPWEPFPEYRDPASAEWQLMLALIKRLKRLAGDRPLVVAPTFYANYVRFRMARNYWDRYASLATIPGVYPIDLLPHFLDGPKGDAERCFQEPFDMHFSAYGHLVLAGVLQAELARLRLLPAAG